MPLSCDTKSFAQARLIKADDDPASRLNYGDAHLAGFLYHVVARVRVGCHIAFFIDHAVFLEEFFGHLAIHARRCGIDHGFFLCGIVHGK